MLSTNSAGKKSSNRAIFASFRAWDHRAQTHECLIVNHGNIAGPGLASACRSRESDDIFMAFALLTAALLGVGSLPPKWQLEAYRLAFASRSGASGAPCFTGFLKR